MKGNMLPRQRRQPSILTEWLRGPLLEPRCCVGAGWGRWRVMEGRAAARTLERLRGGCEHSGFIIWSLQGLGSDSARDKAGAQLVRGTV